MKTAGTGKPLKGGGAWVADLGGQTERSPKKEKAGSSGQLRTKASRSAAKSTKSADQQIAIDSVRALPLLLLYLALVYIRPHEYVAALIGFPIVASVLVCAFLVWIFQSGKDFSAPHNGLMLGLLAMMSISVAAAGWLGGAFRAITDFLPIMVLFLVTSTSRFGPEHFRKVFLVIGLCCTVLAIHGIDQVETGIGWSGAKLIEGRITYLGFLGDPNDLALAFLVALPMTLYWGRTAKFSWMRIGAWIAAVVQMVGIYLTNSRGGLVALGSMIMIYAVRRFGYLRGLAVVPAFALAFVFLAPSRLAQISSDEHSAAGRVDSWYEGIQMFLANPFWGVGKGFYTEYNRLTAHNSMVLVFAEMGLFGYFFWFSLLVLTFVMLRSLLKLPKSDALADSHREQRRFHELAMTLGYSFAGYLMASMFLSRSYVFLLFFLQALIVALFLAARRRWPDDMPNVQVSQMFGALIGLELASIVIMYLLTRILL